MKVIFLKDGNQTLSVQAEDLAGNKMIIQEKSFIIDTQKPRIKIQGIDNGRWKYQAGVGYATDINDTNSLSLDYNYQGEGSKFRNNVVSVNYNYKF